MIQIRRQNTKHIGDVPDGRFCVMVGSPAKIGSLENASFALDRVVGSLVERYAACSTYSSSSGGGVRVCFGTLFVSSECSRQEELRNSRLDQLQLLQGILSRR